MIISYRLGTLGLSTSGLRSRKWDTYVYTYIYIYRHQSTMPRPTNLADSKISYAPIQAIVHLINIIKLL